MLSKTRLFTKKINNNIILSRFYRPTHFPVDDEKISNNNNNNCNDNTINNECLFVLKISGIWETSDNYGLTYKFNKLN
jgi:hypothetical protein